MRPAGRLLQVRACRRFRLREFATQYANFTRGLHPDRYATMLVDSENDHFNFADKQTLPLRLARTSTALL